MIAELAALADHNWARVAGADTGLPPEINGHDEFVAGWLARMRSALHGLPVGVFHQPFASAGFNAAPVKKPADVEVVVVPGSKHPEQAIVVGAHPDGEPWSKGSAFDDASGCVIMLGLARELGTAWRAHGLPERTVEFVLFDGEEQGLDGSISYVFDLRHGAVMSRPVFMIDEEQSGIGYPARPFGLHSQAPMPSFAVTNAAAPLVGFPSGLAGRVLKAIGSAGNASPAALNQAMRRANQAGASAWSTLHGAYPSIHFRGGTAPTFGSQDRRYLDIGFSNVCCSDNAPFELLGLPTVTFAGNSDYYSGGAPWSFPYDQPEDTLQAMACDTGGSPVPGPALAAALELPMLMSEQLVQAYAPPAAGHGIAVFSLPPGAGAAVRLQAFGAASARWTFGDGDTATGASVTHVYKEAGSYPIVVRSGSVTSSWHISVSPHVPILSPHGPINPPPRRPWHPRQLASIAGCH